MDVVSVVHLGRTVTAHQRSALEARDPVCVVERCSARHHLEIDHVDGWGLTRQTTIDRPARLWLGTTTSRGTPATGWKEARDAGDGAAPRHRRMS